MSKALRVNGEARVVGAETVADLLRDMGVDAGRRGVAVAVNGAVVRRPDWPSTRLAAGDSVEVVRPFSGG